MFHRGDGRFDCRDCQVAGVKLPDVPALFAEPKKKAKCCAPCGGCAAVPLVQQVWIDDEYRDVRNA